MNMSNLFAKDEILLKTNTDELIGSNQRHRPQATVRLDSIPSVVWRYICPLRDRPTGNTLGFPYVSTITANGEPAGFQALYYTCLLQNKIWNLESVIHSASFKKSTELEGRCFIIHWSLVGLFS